MHAWPYFFLKDTRDHTVVTVAKRLFVLDQSLHFPDLGGCCAANDPHFLKSELAQWSDSDICIPLGQAQEHMLEFQEQLATV